MESGNFKSLILGILVGAAILGVVLYFMGVFTPPVIIEQVKQPPPQPSPSPCNGTQHQVKVSTLTVAPTVDIEFAVLCKDDVITWGKGNGVKHFDVDFVSGTPLKGKNGVDKPHFSDNPGDESGNAKDLNLQPGNYAYFSYTVNVKDIAGKDHIKDPGVIIVK